MYGANKSMCSLILELKDKYNINPIVLLSYKGSVCNFLDRNGIKYFVFKFFWWVYEGSSYRAAVISFVKQIRNIWKIVRIYIKIKNNKIDLVYTNGIPVNIGYFLSRMIKCPHIWHIREKMEAFNFKFSLGKRGGKWILWHGAEIYICISNFIRKSYENYLPQKKVKVVYNGIQIKENVKTKLTGVINLCIIGLICNQKNQIEALKALNILINERNHTNIILHIVGGAKDNYLKSLNDFVKENNLTTNVIFHGHMEDINPILNNIHIGLNCAIDEAFGRVTVEFMMNEIPVIASNSGANPEIVLNGINGELYEIFNIDDLANKIEIYITNFEQIITIGKSARDYAKRHFSLNQNTSSIYEIINEELY